MRTGLPLACVPCLLLYAGCAQVGPPLPPSAQLPAPPTDLRALRSGDTVRLAWTSPNNTSDGARLRGAVEYHLCAWDGNLIPPPLPKAAATPRMPARVSPEPIQPQVPPPVPSGADAPTVPTGQPLPPCPLEVTIDAQLGSLNAASAAISISRLPRPAADVVTVALGAYNDRHQRAGWSNPVLVPTTPVAPPPTLRAVVSAAGVTLSWPETPAAAVHIYRQVVAAPTAAPAPPSTKGLPPGLAAPAQEPNTPMLVATVPAATQRYLDATMTWGRQYRYWARSAVGSGAAQAESEDSAPITVAVDDVFPPPVPTGLQLVASPGTPPSIDLSWESVTARGLAGYNVYRQLPGSAAWEKRNLDGVLPTPVFHDTLPPGASAGIRYAVTAIDHAGNESQRGTPVPVPE